MVDAVGEVAVEHVETPALILGGKLDKVLTENVAVRWPDPRSRRYAEVGIRAGSPGFSLTLQTRISAI
jgi:hypothetical protein